MDIREELTMKHEQPEPDSGPLVAAIAVAATVLFLGVFAFLITKTIH